jgi:hypothetical protein
MSKSKHDRKIAKVMREFKKGKLKSGSGDIVEDRDQALAIALNEARRVGKEKRRGNKNRRRQ